MFKNKKGLDMWSYWVEFLFFMLLLIGLIFRFFVKNILTNIVVILLCAFIAGRIIYEKRRSEKTTYIIIIIGFILGIILGYSFLQMIAIIIIFVGGFELSYYLHQQGYIK